MCRSTLFVLLLSFVLPEAFAAALSYSNAINDSSWRLHSSVHSCRLEHNIPFYGQAVFRTRAGEASGFYLRSSTARMQDGQADLFAVAPLWKAEQLEQKLASVPVKQGRRPLWLNSELTERLLAKLYSGENIELRAATWFDSQASQARLALSTIGFQQSYRDYLRCVSGLLPRNFDQLRRTALLFPGGDVEELPLRLTAQLDQMLKLVKHDNKIRYFYIDGHSDSVGDRADNLELSKKRAMLVAQYLERRGIPKDWITLRWHGERYPVASNGSVAGRAKNRRVTVRMERVEEIEVLPLADQAAGQ
ncbi:flagellar protein MotY [Agaribacterium haliotis]|uniref:flagellar protein MotY n=1 Tax=Agaribacterium haliotis TaxID=2013869 RepID=UPI001EFC636F|nr:OmpA family protein [Agaribacterium haliotis]